MKYLKKIASFSIALTLLNVPLWSMPREDAKSTTKTAEMGSYRNNLTMFLQCLEARYPSNSDFTLNSDVKRHIGQFLSALFKENSLDYLLEKVETSIISDTSPLVSPDGRTFFTISKGTGCLWSTKAGHLTTKLEHNADNTIQVAAFSPDSKTLAIGSEDGAVSLYNAQTGKLITELIRYESYVDLILFSPDGKTFFISSVRSGAGHLCDIQKEKRITYFKSDPSCFKSSAAFSPDSKTLAIGSSYGTVYLCNTQTGKVEIKFEVSSSGINSIEFSPDGEILLILLGDIRDRTVCLVSAETGSIIKKLPNVPNNGFSSARFSPDGKKILIIKSLDKSVHLWDIEKDTSKMLEGHSKFTYSAQFSPDGKTVITGSNDEEVGLWDTETGNLIRMLKGDIGPIHSAQFSPDGKTVIIRSVYNTIRLWKRKSCEETDWILTQANFEQLDLICRAAKAKRAAGSFTITQGTPDYAIFMSMPNDAKTKVRDYLTKWYSIKIQK